MNALMNLCSFVTKEDAPFSALPGKSPYSQTHNANLNLMNQFHHYTDSQLRRAWRLGMHLQFTLAPWFSILCEECSDREIAPWITEKPHPTVSIAELEAILRGDCGPQEIEIMPNGEIRAVPFGTKQDAKPEVLTMKYAMAEYY